ncbi:MAG: TAT-variant-translocated molybdopterin oxidoreductase [Phycisphaeraceae bacterium]|nr:TAT-variant-translocated molybdopterin oxidoreductase [Phycisphaeraceae bacterium]
MAEKTIDQCPSTRGKREVDRAPRHLSETSGRPVWRSVDEFVDKPEFREWLHREFPSRASELLEGSRRDFLKVMGASLALAGAATIPGCRRPEHTIYAYSRSVPEDQVPGRATFYATAMPLPGGGAEGLLIETHEGRPTKVEGNPLHPVNQGRSSVWSQASVLDLYDPHRLMQVVYKNPARGPLEATWDDFATWARGSDGFSRYDSSRGRGLALVMGKQSGPTREAMVQSVRRRWPEARVVAYEPLENPNSIEAARLAFGQPMREELAFERAKRMVLVERDPAYGEADELRNARGMMAQRAPMRATDGHGNKVDMSRIYAVESALSVSGGKADHRMRLAPSLQPAFVVSLAKAVMQRLGGGDAALRAAIDAVPVPAGVSINGVWVEQCAQDLVDHRGASVVLVGASLPLGVHALALALNAALGAIGPVVRYRPMAADLAMNGHRALNELGQAIDAGEVSTIVCLNANPVYDAPVSARFAERFEKVPTRVTLSVQDTETAAASTWRLNGTHYLEQWGDVQAADGTLSIVQPMIAPLYFGKSEIELLAFLAGETFEEEARLTHLEETARKGGAVVVDGPEGPVREGRADGVFVGDLAKPASDGGLPAWPDGHHAVRATWRRMMRERFGVSSRAEFEKRWRRSLHDGLLAGSAEPARSPTTNPGALADAIRTIRIGAAPSEQSMDVLCTAGRTLDGRFAGNAWLQELPDIGSMTTWDNPALISPGTARKMGLVPGGENPKHVYLREHTTGKMVRLRVEGRTLELPVWICPGLADDTIVLRLGYGRVRGGTVAEGAGFDTYAVRPASGYAASGATLERVPGEYWIASTQNHWSLEGRTEIVRRVELPAWQKYGDHVIDHKDEYQLATSRLNFAEQLGTVSHAPPNRAIYHNPFNKGDGDGKGDAEPGSVYAKSPQWGMTIDMASCIGCGVCTIACQSENNIPVVGKREVAKGREMTWIRVDRYFVGNNLNEPEEVLHQPVACVHCENAPCEVVCPVNATVHGPEGHNYMIYNRCIGTRYCANNCPYKVRRFNFFDYGTLPLDGGLNTETSRATQGLFDDRLPPNQHFIPPRLRARLSEIEKMQKNPNVTVRSRGVMEKCTYCIQRTNNAKIETKLKGLDHVPEGFVQTACQQACPTGAIVFGDILDPKSAVYQTRESGRNYAVLGYLNTRPRTTHLMAVYNPNPEILKVLDEDRYKYLDWHPHDVKWKKKGLEPHYRHLDGQGDQPHASAGTSFIDLHRRDEDAGYALSLKVLQGALGQGGLL